MIFEVFCNPKNFSYSNLKRTNVSMLSILVNYFVVISAGYASFRGDDDIRLVFSKTVISQLDTIQMRFRID